MSNSSSWPREARLLSLALTAAWSLPLVIISGWSYRLVFTSMGARVDDDNVWVVTSLLVVLLIFLMGSLCFVTAELLHPAAQRMAAWIINRRERRRGQLAAALERDENMRIAQALAVSRERSALLENVLTQQRIKAMAERQTWMQVAADQLQPLPETGDGGIFKLYARATEPHRALIREGYHAMIDQAHPRHAYHRPLDIAEMPPLARLLYLPVAIDATDGPTSYERLDLDASRHDASVYVYRSVRQVPDFAKWTASLSAISAYLGGRWRVKRGIGATVELSRLPDIPEAFALPPNTLQPGELYLGQDVTTAQPVRIPFAQMSHTIAAGPTGMGKSVLLHTLMASVMASPHLFEAIYLVDLKFGLELQDYETLGPKFKLTTSASEVVCLVQHLLGEMERRGAALKAARKRDWDGPLILVVIDEFADVLLGQTDKKTREAIETGLVRLTNLSRALGFRFWIQSQKTTVDALPAAIRTNLQSIVSFRMVTPQAAALLFGGIEGLPVDTTMLARGPVVYRDGRTSETIAVQGPLVTFEDVARIARPD